MKLSMRFYKRSNGYYYYEIVRHHPLSLKTRDYKEARALYKIVKQEYLKGRIIKLDGDNRITLEEFKEKFFAEHTEIADDTKAAYDLAVRLLMDSLSGSMLLSRIDDSKIRKFKNDCLTRGVKKVSINTYLRHLRGFFNKAHAWGDLNNKLPIEFFKIPKRHPRTLNPDEIDILLKHSYHCHFEMHRVIKFALWTGCRREEMHTLTWQRVKADTCTVIGKGNKERTIPLLPESIKALGTPKDIGYVFYHPHIDKYSKDFKSIARDCSIDDISLHKLRHTAATQMLASGIPLEYVQEILGHEDISTTRIYAKILQDRLKQEMKKMKY